MKSVGSQNKKTNLEICYPKVAIIILNWNGWRDTIECLESLQDLSYFAYEIILVDNGSTDDSIHHIRKWADRTSAASSAINIILPDRKRVEGIEREHRAGRHMQTNLPKTMVLIRNRENLGFAGGNNVGLRYALQKEYEYIWLLNNDTVVHSNSLLELVKLGERHKNAGMIGSLILDYYRRDKIQSVGQRSILRFFHRDFHYQFLWEIKGLGVIVPLWLWAASILVRAECLKDIGLFDEKYFVSEEDKDWCFRARRKSWHILSCLRSIVWHKGNTKMVRSQTNGGPNIYRNRSIEYFEKRGYYELRNNLYFIIKHLPYFLPLALISDLGLLIKIVVFHDTKVRHLKVLLRAMRDGLSGRMGKRRE